MLVFATSDKGGTGRSVTSGNLVYRRALQGSDVCYLDFDFGSPTAGSIFQIYAVERGSTLGGLHSYLKGEVDTPHRLDVWTESDRVSLRGRPDGAGQLVLFPGDISGGEFPSTPAVLDRCVRLLLRLDEDLTSFWSI
jgi:MinD-like ATPase involved in chromosome partitioning or flagellar assembly